MRKPFKFCLSLPSDTNEEARWERENLLWCKRQLTIARREYRSAKKNGLGKEEAEALDYIALLVVEVRGPASSIPLLRRLIRLQISLGNRLGQASASLMLAIRMLEAGRISEALRQAPITWQAVQEAGFEKFTGRQCQLLGQEFLRSGQNMDAQRWFELALTPLCLAQEGTPGSSGPTEDAEAKTLSDENSRLLSSKAGVLLDLSRALEFQGRLYEARERQHEACSLWHLSRAWSGLGRGLLRLAQLEHRLGRIWNAAALCQEAASVLTAVKEERLLHEARRLHHACCVAAGKSVARPQHWARRYFLSPSKHARSC